MRFKKTLAGILAGALTITSAIVVPLTLSADQVLTGGSLGSAVLEENQWNEGNISNPSLTLDSKWGNAASVEGYASVDIEYTCGAVDEIENLYLVAQSGTMPNGWFQTTAKPAASGKISLDLSTVQDKTYEAIVFQVEPKSTYSIGDTFDPKIEVTSAKFVSADPDEQGVTKIQLKYNSWGDGFNYQVSPSFTIEGIDNWTTTAPEAIEILKNKTVTVSFSFKKATYNSEAFDTSKLGVQGVVQTNGTNGLWKTIDATQKDGVFSIVMEDFETIFGDKTGAVNFAYVVSTDSANVTDGDENSVIDVSLSDFKVEVTTNTVAVEEVTLDESTLSLKKGETATLTATVKPDNATEKTVIWESSDENIATVDQTGKVTAVASGPATITVTSKADETKKATCEVTVTNPAIGIEAAPVNVLVGASANIAVTVNPPDADKLTYTYVPKDTSIATVDADGKVTGKAKGETVITVTAKEIPTLTAECKVTVTDKAVPATGIKLDNTDLKLEVEGTAAIKATVTPEGSTDTIEWSTSDAKIATVDQNGKVTAVAVGEAVITAKANETVSATCKVTVTAKTIAITSVTLDKTEATVEEGADVQLTATVNPSDTTEDKTVAWTSSDETVATVDNTGKVTGVKAGTAEITATAGAKSAKCAVTVTAKKTEPEGGVINIPFEDKTYELKVVDASSWGAGYNRAAQANIDVTIDGVTYEKTTYGDIKNKTLELTGITFKNCDLEGVGASNITVSIFLQGRKDWSLWATSDSVSMEKSSITWDLSKVGAKDDDVIMKIGYQINISGADVEAVEAMDVDEVIKLNDTSSEKPGEENVLWEGTQEMPDDWSKSVLIPKEKFAGAKAGDKLILTFTAESGAQIALKYDAENWPAIPGFVELNGGNDYQDISGTSYTYTLTDKDIEAINSANNLVVSGKLYTLTKAVLSQQADPGDPDDPNDPDNPDDTTPPVTNPPAGNFTSPETTTTTPGGDTTSTPSTGTPVTSDTTKLEDNDDGVVVEFAAGSVREGAVLDVAKAGETATSATYDITLKSGGVAIQPDGTLTITITVPAGLLGADSYYVYRVEADGTYTDMLATFADGKVTFKTGHLSEYIISTVKLTDTSVSEGEASSSEAAQNPDNGDAANTGNADQAPAGNTNSGNTDDKNVATGVAIAFIPAAAAAIGVIISKKRK